ETVPPAQRARHGHKPFSGAQFAAIILFGDVDQGEARFELFGTFRDVSHKAVAHAAGHLSSGPEPSFRLLIGTTQRSLRIAAKHCSECPLITLGGPHPVERLGHAATGLLLP